MNTYEDLLKKGYWPIAADWHLPDFSSDSPTTFMTNGNKVLVVEIPEGKSRYQISKDIPTKPIYPTNKDQRQMR